MYRKRSGGGGKGSQPEGVRRFQPGQQAFAPDGCTVGFDQGQVAEFARIGDQVAFVAIALTMVALLVIGRGRGR